MKTPQRHITRQKGTVLIVALIFLIVLTLLGVSAMDGTVLEAKLASNYQETNFALRTTEIGSSQAELHVSGLSLAGTLLPNSSVDVTSQLSNTAIARDHGISADTDNSQYTYKGLFPQPRASADLAGGQLAVFDVTTTGSSADGPGSGGATIRLGVGRWVPKPGNDLLVVN